MAQPIKVKMTNLVVEDQVKMSMLEREFLDNIGAEVSIGVLEA